MKTEKLVQYIKNHSHEVINYNDTTITVVEHYAHSHSEEVQLPATYEAVRAWLGY